MTQPLIPIGDLPADAVQLLVDGLCELPYKRSAKMIEFLISRSNAVLNPPAAKPKRTSKTKPRLTAVPGA